MKKVFSFFLLIFIISFELYSQNEVECGTVDPDFEYTSSQPWFGNEEFLQHFTDSVFSALKSTKSKSVENVAFRVPVQFWVYTMADGSAGGDNVLPNDSDFQNIIDELNTVFRNSNTLIRFYMLGDVQYVRNGNEIAMSETTANLVAYTHYVSDALNIHIIDRIYGDPTVSSFTYTLRDIQRWIFAERWLYTEDLSQNYLSTYAHEVGHYFDLYHTFKSTQNQLPCLQEPVTRGKKWNVCNPLGIPIKNRRCLYTGDYLCGTEADPNMQDHGTINPNTLQWECNGSAYCIDQYGETYHPDIYNLMAYGNTPYKNRFSSDQVSVMQFKAMKMGYMSNNTQFDIYEPDDNPEMARNFDYKIGFQQTHTFHNRAIGESFLQDEDWFRFTIPAGQNSGVFELYTETANDGIDANTQLSLYKDDVLIKYDDNSNGNGFSYLKCSGLAAGTYYIRVTFDNPTFLNPMYSYKITFHQCVKGDICLTQKVVNPGETFKAAATNTLTASCTSTFHIRNGSTVRLKAGNTIHLTSGFIAEPGSDFHAEITNDIDCSDTDVKMPINTEGDLNTVQNEKIYQEPIEDEENSVCDNRISVFPNPNNGTFTVSVLQNQSTATMSVSDMLGNVILSKQFTGQFAEADISAFPGGVYLLKINAEGRVYTQKIVFRKE